MLRYILLPAAILVLTACGEPSRAIVGTAPRITVEQTAWLEQGVERDCARIPQITGKRVLLGRFIARLEDEVFAGEHLMNAGMRGLLHAGCHVFGGEASGTPVDYVLSGSAYLASETAEDGRRSLRRYTFAMSLKDQAGEVLWTQSYSVLNETMRPRFK
jgi:hypothetical protein